MNIMFTSVGRRVELIQEFHRAAKELNVPLQIIGADISDTAPALYFCDKMTNICRVKDPKYISELLLICKEEKIDCLIPTIDTDLLLLSSNKNKFEEIGTKVLISSEAKVALCRDKTKSYQYFKSLGLKAPLSIDSIDDFHLNFPVFIKPKDGSSSIDTYKVDDYEDLVVFTQRIKDYIIQPYIDGIEYTIDIFCDYFGKPIYITPRKRLAVRSGEVLKTEICQDSQIIEAMQKLIQDFKPCGQITVQMIREKETNEDYYIEINPRFGGGAPLSIKAGADSAGATLKLIQEMPMKYQAEAAIDGKIYSRYDQSICVSDLK